MNATSAILESEKMVQDIISTAKRVMEVKGITLIEAIEYGRNVRLKYAKTGTEKAAIDIRHDEAMNIVMNYSDEELKFNGFTVKSITTTAKAKEAGAHVHTLLINQHIIHGIDKDDCLNEFESDKDRYDNAFRNSITWYIKL